MKYTRKMTSKGQVTVPKEIRDYLGIKLTDPVVFTLRDSGVSIESSNDFWDLQGSLARSNLKRPSEAETDQKVLSYVGKQYRKKN